MAEFRNMLGSDEDSNEDIDHIPKTPGPPVVSDHESDEDKSGDEKEVKDNQNDSESDSDSSSSPSDSSNDNNRNTRNDSEVERSDNENEDNEQNEEIEDNRETVKPIDTNEPNDNMSSDENEDNDHKNVINESQDNDSEDEDIVRRVSPKKKRQLEDNSDSSEDESSDRIKKQRIESNDNEENDDKSDDNEDNEDKNEEIVDKSAKAKDIFGEMSSEDEDEDEDRPKDSRKDDDEKDSDRESGNENKDNQRRDEESGDEEAINREGASEQTFGDEEEPQEEPIPETRIEVEIPRIVADLGREVHFVKLPNFLSIDTHPYDPQWYEDEIDEDENLDDEGRARLKLKVENTIRWRNVVDKETNELKKESNTRVVRWSDGSHSLHLGEEIFDIHKLQLMTGDNNHLFIRQGTGLQGQTVFRSKLNFRPFSTESFTHRKLTLSLADRSQKTQKIRVLPNVGKDPEAHRTEMIKKEEDRLKASIRREHKQKRMRESRLTRGPTASYLEPDGDEDEDEEGISLARIKNQYKRGSFNKSYDDPELSAEESKANDDDDSEDDLFDKKTEKRKATHIVESDDE